MRVLKFGGTSVASPERVRAVATIVAESRADGPVAVVVSAFGGVTDALLKVARLAEARDGECREILARLAERHRAAAEVALPGERPGLEAAITGVHEELDRLAGGISTLGEASARTLDSFLAVGELVSAQCMAAALRAAGVEAEMADARELIVTGPEFGAARVHEDATNERIRARFRGTDRVQVIPGFVAATDAGETTTLGRGGSDHTASIVGAALLASVVEIWTDVDGVMSADPRVVQDAVLVRRLSYDELMELSHFGAEVVHPQSVHPARAHGIPLRIRNTFRPEGPGTLIAADTAPADGTQPVVRGLAAIPHVDLLRLEGSGMVGVPGIAGRLFGALARRGVNVILISQASSEHSICFAVAPSDTDAAARGVGDEFDIERRAGLVDPLVIERDLTVVAAVGAGMRERSGVAGRLFAALGRHGINVRAIAQGSSELNISLVVAADDAARTVRTIHDAFFVSGARTVDVYLAGVGQVGRSLLAQLDALGETLARDRHVRLRLAGVAVSSGALLDPAGIPFDRAEQMVRGAAVRSSGDEMVRVACSDRGRDRIFVDCTASADMAGVYVDLLRAGAAVVSANKLPFAGRVAEWTALTAGPARLYHETTVGAALPVLGTLRDLVATGDRVRRIEGVLSGTLALLFDELAQGRPFSEIVREARSRGYTEPDPREDLAGRDVARKLLVLARLAGRPLEPGELVVESVLGEEWSGLPVDEFLARLPDADEGFARQVSDAARRGKRLLYLATVDGTGARAGAREVDVSHPALGGGSDNVVLFTTDRYSESPLLVRGPGAGPELTASGVLADVLRAIAEGDGR